MRLHTMVVIGAVLCAGAVFATPVSTCTNAAGVNTCNLYESDANGNDAEIASQVGSGVMFSTGWLVLKENNGTDTDPANWSDLVLISGAKTIQLISDPDTESFTFPITINGGVTVTAADVTNGMYNGVKLTNATLYKLETAPPTVFNPKNAGSLTDTINVFSDAPPPTEPEPAPFALVTIGIVMLLVAKWGSPTTGFIETVPDAVGWISVPVTGAGPRIGPCASTVVAAA